MDTRNHTTSWGQRPPHQDVRALRRYNWLLRLTATVGEILSHTLVAAVAFASVAYLYLGNFENLIFRDGTNLACMFDGDTGAIKNVR